MLMIIKEYPDLVSNRTALITPNCETHSSIHHPLNFGIADTCDRI